MNWYDSIRDGDAEMRLHYILTFLFICLTVFASCGEDSEEAVTVTEGGDVYGTVTDK